MQERSRLLLAVAIGEWASALDHLHALQEIGERVPYSIIGRMQSELSDLCELWVREQGDARLLTAEDREQVVVEARDYCTEHGNELVNQRI